MLGLVTLLGLLCLCRMTCLTNYAIKHSLEECSFHYAANDPNCTLYLFTHCQYYQNTTTYWLWIFRDEISSQLFTQFDLQACAAVCCKDNSSLPLGLEGYTQCQERRFAMEVVEVEMIELIVELAFGLMLLSLASSLLYALYQSLEQRLLELGQQPAREIEMRIL